MTRLLLLTILLLTALPAQAAPPDTTARPWFASVRYSHDALSRGRPPWRSVTAVVQRQLRRGSVVGTVRRAERFDRGDAVMGVAAWSELWQGAYATVQTEHAFTTHFSPEWSSYAELYQGFGAGWEAAASFGMHRYPTETIYQPGAALARYVGRWYLRTKTTLLPRAGELGVAQSFMARRYWDAPHAYVGVSGGVGRGVEVIGSGPEVAFTRSYGIALSAQYFVTEHVGLAAEAHYSDADFFTYRGASAGLMVRW